MDGNSIDFLLVQYFYEFLVLGWPDLHISNSIFYYTVHYICTIGEICYCMWMAISRFAQPNVQKWPWSLFSETKKLKCSMQMYVRDRCINLQNIIFLGVLLNACAAFSWGEVCATREVRREYNIEGHAPRQLFTEFRKRGAERARTKKKF